MGVEESQRLGASGRLNPYFQAKIVDPDTGIALPPLRTGELWVRGPLIMKGERSFLIFAPPGEFEFDGSCFVI